MLNGENPSTASIDDAADHERMRERPPARQQQADAGKPGDGKQIGRDGQEAEDFRENEEHGRQPARKE